MIKWITRKVLEARDDFNQQNACKVDSPVNPSQEMFDPAINIALLPCESGLLIRFSRWDQKVHDTVQTIYVVKPEKVAEELPQLITTEMLKNGN